MYLTEARGYGGHGVRIGKKINHGGHGEYEGRRFTTGDTEGEYIGKKI